MKTYKMPQKIIEFFKRHLGVDVSYAKIISMPFKGEFANHIAMYDPCRRGCVLLNSRIKCSPVMTMVNIAHEVNHMCQKELNVSFCMLFEDMLERFILDENDPFVQEDSVYDWDLYAEDEEGIDEVPYYRAPTEISSRICEAMFIYEHYSHDMSVVCEPITYWGKSPELEYFIAKCKCDEIKKYINKWLEES